VHKSRNLKDKYHHYELNTMWGSALNIERQLIHVAENAQSSSVNAH